MPSPRSRGIARLLPARKGRVLAVKWGLNPNSSSLGVDVTFLLLGATALSLATPIVSAMIRLRIATSRPPKESAKTSNAKTS